MDSLVGKRTPESLRKALKGLRKASKTSYDGSSALYDAYEKAMDRIQCQKGDLPRDAMLILSWIVYAKRPITVPELQHALAVDIGKHALDESNIPPVNHIVKACAPLVTVDEESNIIRLVHYTAQEYFERPQKNWFPNAETDITKICVTYLSLSIFESGLCQTDYEFKQRLESNPLYNYAAHNWGHHARQALTLCEEVVNFLECEIKAEAASQALMGVITSDLRMKGMHLAAYFGVHEAINVMLGSQYLDSKDRYGQTPLYLAAENGHEKVVELLLGNGADVNAQGGDFGNALQAASYGGHEKVVELLLGKGADVNAQRGNYGNALQAAAQQER